MKERYRKLGHIFSETYPDFCNIAQAVVSAQNHLELWQSHQCWNKMGENLNCMLFCLKLLKCGFWIPMAININPRIRMYQRASKTYDIIMIVVLSDHCPITDVSPIRLSCHI